MGKNCMTEDLSITMYVVTLFRNYQLPKKRVVTKLGIFLIQNRSDFEIHGREPLSVLLRQHQFQQPSDKKLEEMKHDESSWQDYRSKRLKDQILR